MPGTQDSLGAAGSPPGASLAGSNTFAGNQVFNGKTTHNGGVALHRVTFADANYTVLTSDTIVATAAAFTASRTITLPTAASFGAGGLLIISDDFQSVGAVNTLTIQANGAENILTTAAAANTLVKNTARCAVILLCTGTAWIVLSNL
jgi:hypothetical protein